MSATRVWGGWLVLAMAGGAGVGYAEESPGGLSIVRPEAINWSENKSVPPGMMMSILSGDPTKPGPFTFRAKIPAGYKLPPHRHPDTRTVTVLQGVYYSAAGERFDESKLIAFPPGSYYVTPANTPHFAATKDGEVIIQESGEGPGSGISYVNPAEDPRAK